MSNSISTVVVVVVVVVVVFVPCVFGPWVVWFVTQ